ncbi:MAG: hypothetical protein HWN81_04870 [Candidatus Lokiarchaeota archaeon]|nr:hypothetical protein [Candidatus Lokiarchaeota archaeon]
MKEASASIVNAELDSILCGEFESVFSFNGWLIMEFIFRIPVIVIALINPNKNTKTTTLFFII